LSKRRADRAARRTSAVIAAAASGIARGDSGIALIAVLWVMVVLAALATSFSTSTRTQVNLVRNMAEAAAAEAIADAGIARAAAGVVLPVAQGGLRTEQTIYAWQFAGGEARFLISDEGGKIDLNAASHTLLRDLFEVAGADRRQADALAGAIVAYRGGGASASGGNGVAEGYAGAEENGPFASEPGRAPFAVLEELQQVPGMSLDIYQRVAPALTIYSGQADPDAKAAVPEVREVLTRARGRAIDEGEGGARDEAWPPPPLGPLSILREGTFARQSGVGAFSIHCEGRSAGGAVFARDAVVAIDYGGGRPYSIRAWRQGRRMLFARRGEEAY
jgi:general secretion pathway protein K